MIEIKIGREELGPNDIKVPDNFRKVSRHHGKLEYDNGVLTYIDNDSSNGSFVNGEQVASTRIKKGDDVRLGGLSYGDCYVLDVNDVFEKIKEIENANRTDFSVEFANMKKAYIAYQDEVVKLRQEINKKTQLPRLIATLVPAAVGLILMPFVGGEARIVVISIGSVVSALMGIFTLGKNNDITEELTDIQLKYQPRYKCPKCGKNIPMTIHWKKLEADGCCPFGCGARFVKDNGKK